VRPLKLENKLECGRGAAMARASPEGAELDAARLLPIRRKLRQKPARQDAIKNGATEGG
jgi:hypothetical protein